LRTSAAAAPVMTAVSPAITWTARRQREIADALNQLARDELKRGKGKAAGRGTENRSGTQRARRRRKASQ
jgi:hypothetical protein